MKKLENTAEDQMASPSICNIKWVVLLVVLVVPTFAGFWGFIGFSSVILTSIVLILSTLLLTFTKQKPHHVLVEKLPVTEEEEGEEEVLIKSCDHDHHHELITSPSPSMEDFVPTQLQPDQSETMAQQMEDDQLQRGLQKTHDQLDHDHQDYRIRSSSPDLLSSESDQSLLDDHDHLSTCSDEDSEVEWPFRDNIVYRSPYCSDDASISDEESLIEIALPSGQYVDHNKEQHHDHPNKFQLIQQKLPADFLPHHHHHHHHQSILKQHSLMELLAELNDINEEDNLIEIDISIGSIKCSRFEIEA